MRETMLFYIVVKLTLGECSYLFPTLFTLLFEDAHRDRERETLYMCLESEFHIPLIPLFLLFGLMYSWSGRFTIPGSKEPCSFCMLVKQLTGEVTPEDSIKIGIHLRIAHGIRPWTPIPN